MELQALEIFLDVMSKGSFADVARDRQVAPSSISRTIASLEQELNTSLFQRTTRKIAPTDEGQAYFSKIAPLVEGLRQACESVKNSDQMPQGNIRITASVSFGTHVLIPILQEFMEQYPLVTLDFVLTDRSVDLIDERIDMAVRHGSLNDSSLVVSKLTETQYRVVASPAYLETSGPLKRPEDISDHPALVFDLPQFKSQWVFQKGQQKARTVAIHGRYEVSNALALRALALNGAGVSLLANWLIDEDIKANKLVHLFPQYKVSAGNYDTSIHLITPGRKFIPIRNRLLVAFLKSKFS